MNQDIENVNRLERQLARTIRFLQSNVDERKLSRLNEQLNQTLQTKLRNLQNLE